MEPQVAEIRELDLEDITPNTKDYADSEIGGMKVVIIGRPKSGKSWLIRDLLYHKKHIIPVGMAFCGTEDSSGFYGKIFPKSFIYNEYSHEAIQRFIDRQKLAREHIGDKHAWAVCLIDDCADDAKIFKTPLQQSMYKNGRHFRMLYIVSQQYALDVSKATRPSIDYVFIMREPNLSFRKAIYDNYASVIPTFKDFCAVMDAITEDHTSLVIKNSAESNDWKDCVFYYKAKKTPEVDPDADRSWFGCTTYWEHDRERYNAEHVKNYGGAGK